MVPTSNMEGSPKEQAYFISNKSKQTMASFDDVLIALTNGYTFANGKDKATGTLREMNNEMKLPCAPCGGSHLVTSFSVKNVDATGKVVNLYANCNPQRINVKRNNVIFNPINNPKWNPINSGSRKQIESQRRSKARKKVKKQTLRR